MAAKHTPGPWSGCNGGRCICGMVWSESADHPVATVTRGEWGDPGCTYGEVAREAADANAILIAAAPDLLACVETALAAWEGTGPAIDIQAMRDLIARATGAA